MSAVTAKLRRFFIPKAEVTLQRMADDENEPRVQNISDDGRVLQPRNFIRSVAPVMTSTAPATDPRSFRRFALPGDESPASSPAVDASAGAVRSRRFALPGSGSPLIMDQTPQTPTVDTSAGSTRPRRYAMPQPGPSTSQQDQPPPATGPTDEQLIQLMLNGKPYPRVSDGKGTEPAFSTVPLRPAAANDDLQFRENAEYEARAGDGPSTAEPLARRDSERIIRESGGPRTDPATSSEQLPPSASASPQRTFNSRLPRIMDEIQATEARKIADRNGRLKSAGAQALRNFLEGRGILGAALGAVQAGLIDPSADERSRQREDLGRLNRTFDQQSSREKKLAEVDSIEALADQRRGNNGLSPAKLATQQRGFSNYLAKFYPNGYERGTRKDVDAELDRLQMEPPPPLPKKAAPMRPMVFTPGQEIAVPDGFGGFKYEVPHNDEGKPGPTMTDYQEQQLGDDRRRLELQLGQYNLSRGRSNLGPVTFEEWQTLGGPSEYSGQPSSPAAGSSSPSSSPVREPSPVKYRRRTTGGAPSSLVPTGEPPATPIRYGRGGGGRRGGRGGGGSSFDYGRIEQSRGADALTGLISKHEYARNRAAQAAAKNDNQGRDYWLSQMQVYEDNAQSDPNIGGMAEVGRTGGNQWGYIKFKPQAAQPSAQPRGGRAARAAAPSLTEQQVREHARKNGLDPDKLVERARQRGELH